MPIAALRPLRHRDYAIVWTAGLVSNMGTWLQTVAVGALVTALTGNPIWTAVAYVSSFLPMGLLSPIGGALADRFDRRRVTIIGTLIETMMATLLAVLVSHGYTQPALINSIILVSGCVSAFRMPFQQAMLPDLVPREDLVAAVSLGPAQWNLGRVVGPALAGVVIVAGSFSLAFALNAVSFLAVVIAYVIVRVPSPHRHEHWPGIVSQMKDGAREVRRDPGSRAALLLVAVAAGTAAPFMALIAAMAAEIVPHPSPSTLGAATGALTTAQGIGAVVAALFLPSLVRFGRSRVMIGSMLALVVALIPYALAPSVATAAPAMLFVGGIYILILTGLSAVIQLRARPEYRGRAISLFWAVMSLSFPIGALVQGALARSIGMRATTLASAAALFVAVVIVRITRPQLFKALDDERSLEEVEEPESLATEVEALGA